MTRYNKTLAQDEWLREYAAAGNEVTAKAIQQALGVSKNISYAMLKRANLPTATAPFHSISDVDMKNRTATCAQCGPTKVRYRSTRDDWVCLTSDRKWVERKPGTHGLTPQEAKEYLADKVCRICGTDQDLRVDHCHKTGRIRGALCNPHNLALGLFKDNAEHLRAAADYVEED